MNFRRSRLSVTVAIVAWTCALRPSHAQVDPSALNNSLRAADADLNSTYRELMASLPPAEREKLLLAERAWVTFFAKHQIALRALAAKRNMPPSRLIASNLAETQARRDALRAMPNSSSEINRDQLSRDLAEADANLNKVFSDCSSSLDKSDAALLLATQRAWLSFRDAQARTKNALATALMAVTHRTSQLREFYLGATPAPAVANHETAPIPLESQNSGRIRPDPFERAR